MPARLSVSLLGPLEVRLEGELVGGFEYNKVRALLAYLAAESGQPHTRLHLCAFLWPEASERAARHNLSQALTTLRKALSDTGGAEPLLLSPTESIQLNPSAQIEVDVMQFSALIAVAEAHAPEHRGWHLCTPCARRLQQAAGLYRGDFLAQLSLSDSAPFEEWALLLRERYRQRMLGVLERLARYAEWRGRYEQAAEHTRRQVALEPWLEANQRALMRYLVLAGQTAAALAAYEQLRRALRAELAAEPEAETTALHQQLKAGILPAPAAGLIHLLLPAAPTRLIGREEEVQAGLGQLWDSQVRALSVIGPPGIGKTRLALEVAHALRFDFEEGACWVELAPVSEAHQVPAAVAQALGVREQPGKALATTLAAALKHSHLLLVLDNFEHVLGAAAFVAELLAACPALKLLVTSRAALGIRAEQQFVLAPLRLPAAESTLVEIAGAPAVELFVERARAVRSGFRLTAEHADPVAALCVRLDGLPLAIELIAARARTLAPVDLLRQLEHGLEALADGWRDLPERQRTLRNAIAWSYDRLNTEGRRVFAHLGVFVGGCTPDAAQAVMGDGLSARPVLDTLCESSLVQAQTVAGEARFSLLETLREFALDQLALLGMAEAAQERHAAYFLALAERAERELIGPDQKAWFDRLAREHANLRVALAWSQSHALAMSLRLAAALELYWEVRGHLEEGRRWLRDGLKLGQQATRATRARALLAAGRLAWRQGDLKQAQTLLSETCQQMKAVEDASGLARALYNLGYAVLRQGDHATARTYFEESLDIARSIQDNYAAAGALGGLAQAVAWQGKQFLDRHYTEQALALCQARRDPRNIAGQLMNLGLIAFNEQDLATARQQIEASLAVGRELEDRYLITVCLFNLANVLLNQGDAVTARAYLEEALAIHRAQHDWTRAGATLGTLGHALAMLGDLKGARARQLEGLRLRAEIGDRSGLAMSLFNLAHLEQRENKPARAARLLGAFEAVREALGWAVKGSSQAEYEQLLSDVRAALGEAGFAQALAAGRALSLDEGVALALSPDA